VAQVMDTHMTQPGGINGRGEVATTEVRHIDQASFGTGEQRCVTNRADSFDPGRLGAGTQLVAGMMAGWRTATTPSTLWSSATRV